MKLPSSHRLAQRSGKDFEATIGESLEAYRRLGIAAMDFMPVPMAPAGVLGRHGNMLYTPKGKAPFDVYGMILGSGLAVGAELKASTQPDTALSIVAAESGGKGLQAHQLDALALFAGSKAVARLVWNNGGQVGVLENEGILSVASAYRSSLDAEATGRPPARGSRSIRWEMFKVIEVEVRTVGGESAVLLDWLDA